MKTLHIAVVSPEFPPQIGGVERYAFEYAKALAKAGHQVTVFTCPHREGEVEADGLTISTRLRRNYALDRNIVHETEVDAWHVMNAAYAWVACETSTPVVVSVHGNDFLRPYIPVGDINLPLPSAITPKWLGNYTKNLGKKHTRDLMLDGLEKASRILTNSRYTEQVLLEHFPQLKGRTTVGLVGVSEEYLEIPHKAPSTDEPTRLITVSRLSEPRKNIHLVLEALGTLKTDFSFSYRIVGEGSERASLETLISKLGLEEWVRFCGRLSDEDLKRELAASDLFILTSSILPTSHEGFGIVYLEANGCGVPTLAAKLAGAAEAVDEGRSGFFVEEPSVESIKDALYRFLSGEIRFDSATCRKFAAEFTWTRVVERALPYYQDKAP